MNHFAFLGFLFVRDAGRRDNKITAQPSALFFSFLLSTTVVPTEIDENAYGNFWGQTRCIIGGVKMENGRFVRIDSPTPTDF